MVWFPPAKVNLGLHVLRKRTDGFHDIETCLFPIDWTDMLEIVKSKRFSFSSSGNVIPGEVTENLCVRAYQLLKKDFDLPEVKIHLHKIIPMGAGLGGGSSDAAYTLRGLNDLFELKIPTERLHAYASQLGSDCPFFLYNSPMLARGRGDELKTMDNLDLNGYTLVVVHPNINVPTATAYQKIKPVEERESLKVILQQDISSWKDTLVNDFEAHIFDQFPQIRKIKEKMYKEGAIYASMSGSGSAVYGIFKSISAGVEEIFPDYSLFTQKL
ncbi:MAG: 4-(cytidine 5'-diphospho)-2-C-methyl-D-erythritol kinase [Candidatus Cyclobacteriaceae bacterium M2_1C_046]